MGDKLLCSRDEVAEGDLKEVDLDDGRTILLIRHAGRIHAVEAECPHQGAPLADGEVEDGLLTCCLHFWSWRLDSGEAVDAEKPLAVFSVDEREDGIYLVE